MENKVRLRSLTRRADFLDLRESGRSLHINSWLLVNLRDRDDSREIRLGWTIPRQVGTAVVRNRLRRWGREFMRKRVAGFTRGLDLNVVMKRKETGFYRALSHEDFDEAMAKMLARMGRGA